MVGSADALPDGLDIEQVAPGGLWEWVRASDGSWLGVVTFHIRYRDGRSDR